MNEKQAIAAMKKLWGKKAAWRINNKVPTGEDRERLICVMPILSASEKAAIKARDDRREELLKDPEYLRLAEAAKQAIKNRQEAAGKIYSRRVTIGEIIGGFFIVKGDGDNWAEAVKKARGE